MEKIILAYELFKKKGRTRILSLQTEHNFEDTLIGYVNLSTDELIDVNRKLENKLRS